MGRIVYFTGGARSGKSLQAEKYIFDKEYTQKIYLATSIPFDDEMKARVKKHKEQRGENWITIEGYSNLIEKISPYAERDGVILLDCLTNMVTNLMITDRECDWDNISTDEVDRIELEIKDEVESFFEYVKNQKIDVVVVSNELGMGVVPAYPLGRYFRDICGRMNQIAGTYADEAYMAVSGLQLKLK